ncbi:MAG TPA: FlgD immunoglobulin-like domain containing protein [Candidatus Eisenbacteria bacterium]
MFPLRNLPFVALLGLAFLAGVPSFAEAAPGADFRVLQDTTAVPDGNAVLGVAPPWLITPKVLLAGDSWAQYMWDDGAHNDIFDRFGFEDRRAVSLSLGSDPGAGYTGPEYAISGSEARQWSDTANYPWIANMVAALEANPTIEVVVLSIGGNDVLAGKPGGGWYKQMDLDTPGAEAAFFDRLEDDTFAVIDAALAVRPSIRVMIASYEYPNFNVGFWCFAYACPKRRDLSRDPNNALITDIELNDMMKRIEQRRIAWVASNPRLLFDHGIGLMHFYHGDGQSAPRTLPYPGQMAPSYLPFPGGNPLRPTLRADFRRPNGIDADPIHLNAAGYQDKVANETTTLFLPWFRGLSTGTFIAAGGVDDGWTDGTTAGTSGIRVGDTGTAPVAGLLSFDTSSIPDGATITAASLFLTRNSLTGTNPFTSGAMGVPRLDMKRGTFGAAAVEVGDGTAPADGNDIGVAVGSVKGNGYALRIDLLPAGYTSVNDSGLTQFRLSFPAVSSGTTADYVTFRDGESPVPPVTEPSTLAEFMATSAPFLDVSWSVPSGVADAARPGGLDFRGASPNPFRAGTTLRFALSSAGPARLTIFDVTGRRVARLVDGDLPAGEQALSWDGRNESGAMTAPGFYLARLESAGETRSVRIVRTGE